MELENVGDPLRGGSAAANDVSLLDDVPSVQAVALRRLGPVDRYICIDGENCSQNIQQASAWPVALIVLAIGVQRALRWGAANNFFGGVFRAQVLDRAINNSHVRAAIEEAVINGGDFGTLARTMLERLGVGGNKAGAEARDILFRVGLNRNEVTGVAARVSLVNIARSIGIGTQFAVDHLGNIAETSTSPDIAHSTLGYIGLVADGTGFGAENAVRVLARIGDNDTPLGRDARKEMLAVIKGYRNLYTKNPYMTGELYKSLTVMASYSNTVGRHAGELLDSLADVSPMKGAAETALVSIATMPGFAGDDAAERLAKIFGMDKLTALLMERLRAEVYMPANLMGRFLSGDITTQELARLDHRFSDGSTNAAFERAKGVALRVKLVRDRVEKLAKRK